jgi:hypothetical protein
MRAMTIAVLGLSLGASPVLAQDPANLKSDIKSLAPPAGGAGTFSSAPQHGLKANVRSFKADSAEKASLKSAGRDATPEPANEAVRSSLSNRRSSVDLAAGSVKPQEGQSFAALRQSGPSSFGLRSSAGTPGSLSADSIKQPDAAQKLR